MTRKVLVFGSTGNTGIDICKELKSLGIDFNAFGRKESLGKLDEIAEKYIEGNVLEIDSAKAALNAHDYTDIIIAQGNQNLKHSMIRAEGTHNIISALNALNKKSKSEKILPIENGPLAQRRIPRSDLAYYLVKSMNKSAEGIHSVCQK